MEVYLIRHTRPEIEKGICYGQTDISLADTFEMEWKMIKRKLPQRVDTLFTSPLSRCMQLALKLSEHYGLPVWKDVRLMEMNFGEWEMKNWNDIDQHILNAWMSNYTTMKCPQGESYADVVVRLKDFIAERLRETENRHILVTHGGIIKCFGGIINNNDGMHLKVDYGEVYRYDL